MNFKYFAIFVLVFIFLFCSKPLLAQEIISTETPEIISPSPQLKAFEQYGNYSISEFTGTPNISIPLWTIKSGSLVVPISLDYSGGGVRVDELSGIYGLKWNLNTGGVITRSVMGNLDEGIYGWLNDENKLSEEFATQYVVNNVLPLDTCYSTDSLATYYIHTTIPFPFPPYIGVKISIPVFLLKKYCEFSRKPAMEFVYKQELIDISRGCKDGMPDAYFLSAPFTNCKFTFDNENNPILMPFKKTLIKSMQLGGNKLHGWNVLDEKGHAYSYYTKETTIVNSNCTFTSTNLIQNCFPSQGVTAWMLDTIISNNKADTIIYEYNEHYNQNYYTKESESIIFGSCGQPNDLTISLCNDFRPYKANNKCTKNNRHQGVLLTRIKTKDQLITFAYEANNTDGHGLPNLKTIKVANSLDSNTIREFKFIYRIKNNRVFLDSIIEWGYINGIKSPEKMSHSFGYNEIDLPNRNSYAIDYFGFYNGKLTNQSFIPNTDITYINRFNCGGPYENAADREVDPSFNKAGILEKITHPTKGRTEFIYESNKVFLNSRQRLVDNDTMISFYGGRNLKSQEATFRINENNAFNYITVSNILSGSNNTAEMPYLLLMDSSGSLRYRWDCCIMPHQTEKIELFLEEGIYTFTFVSFHEDDCALITVVNKDIEIIGSGEYDSGGLRIKSITYLSTLGDTLMQKDYNYNVFETNTTSGKHASMDGTTYFNAKYEAVLSDDYRPLCISPAIKYGRYPNLSKVGSAYVGYTNVTENIKTTTGVSSIESAFSFEEDEYMDEFVSVPMPNSPRDSKRGNLIWRAERNSSKELVRETFSSYTYWPEGNNDNYPNCKVVTGVSAKATHYNQIIPENGISRAYQISWGEYYNFSEWLYKTQDSIVEYFPDGGTVISLKNYYYDNPSHAQLTRVLENTSNNKSASTLFYYAHDINETNRDGITMSDLTINKLINANFLAPLKKEGYEGNRLINGVVNNYNESLLLSTVSALYEVVYDTAYSITKRDKYGNILELRRKNDMFQSFKWGYNYQHPVGYFANTTNQFIRFENFEDAKTISGGSFSNDDWESTHCSIKENVSFTGKKCFAFQGSSLRTKNTLPAGKYRIRMWTKMETGTSGTITLTGVPGVTWTANNKWQMQEKIVTLTASSKLTFNPTGSILVDDISIIPYDAQIETFTWAPLVGMTSKTDNNGNTLFFTYDGLGRLIMVKDQDGNIRETHNYNIAQ